MTSHEKARGVGQRDWLGGRRGNVVQAGPIGSTGGAPSSSTPGLQRDGIV